ncbi:MAG: DHH family phosphoesterase, partial [Phycisphaerae bacterium]
MADRPGPPREVTDAIDRARRPLIVGHVRPDADCLGAMSALALSLGHDGRCEPRLYYRVDQVSGRLAFLAALAQYPVAPPEQCRSCDAVIVLDTAQSGRAAAEPPLGDLAAAGVPV